MSFGVIVPKPQNPSSEGDELAGVLPPLAGNAATITLPMRLADLVAGELSSVETRLRNLRLESGEHIAIAKEGSTLDKSEQASWIHTHLEYALREAETVATANWQAPNDRDYQDPGDWRRLRYTDSHQVSHTLYDVMSITARTVLSVREELAILSGHSTVGVERCVSAATVALTHLSAKCLNVPSLGWTRDALLIDAPESEKRASLEQVFFDVMELRRFCFSEFITGRFVLLNDWRGKDPSSPFAHTFPNYHISGFELLSMIAKCRGDTRLCTDLLSPVLSETWRALHGEKSWSFAEEHALYLPFEFSDEACLTKKLVESHSPLASDYKLLCVKRGIELVRQTTQAFVTLGDKVPVYDHLGRLLWHSLSEAEEYLKPFVSRSSQDPSTQSEVGVQYSRQFATRVEKLSELIEGRHPSWALDRGSRKALPGERVLLLPEVDVLLAEQPLTAAEFARTQNRDAEEYFEAASSRALADLRTAVTRLTYARGSLIPLEDLEPLAIGNTKGEIIFRSVEHLCNYVVKNEAWLASQAECLIASSRTKRLVSAPRSEFGKVFSPEDEYLFLARELGYVSEIALKEARMQSRDAERDIPRTRHLFVGNDFRSDLPKELGATASKLCAEYPALWPLFYPCIGGGTGYEISVPGFNDIESLIKFLTFTPEYAEQIWNGGKAIETEAARALSERDRKDLFVCWYTEERFNIAEGLVLASGFEDRRKRLLAAGNEWGTAPTGMKGCFFVDEGMRVVAKNIGHYISIYLTLAEVSVDSGVRLATALQPDPYARVDKEHLQEKIRVSGNYADALLSNELERKLVGYEEIRRSRAMLETLSERAVQLKINEGKLSTLEALAILNEVSEQLFGAPAYLPVFDPWIKGAIFSDKEKGFRCSGAELLRYVVGEKPLFAEVVSRREIMKEREVDAAPLPLVEPSITAQKFDLTQGRPLRTDFAQTGLDHYLSICSEYPALSSLFFPRKVGSSEKCVQEGKFDALVFQSAFMHDPDRAHEEWQRQESALLSKSLAEIREAKIEFIDNYCSQQVIHLDVTRDLLDRAVGQAGMSVRNWSTVPDRLQGTVFVDGTGWVVAENFGHLISVCHELLRLTAIREIQLASKLGVTLTADQAQFSVAAIGFHDILEWYVSSRLPTPKKFKLADKTVPLVTLTALSPKAIREAIESNTLSPTQALGILDEVTYQMFGVEKYCTFYQRDIRLNSFCDPARKFGVTGRYLLKALSQDLGVPPADSPTKEPPAKVSVKTVKEERERRKHSLYQEMFRNREVQLGTLFFALCAVGDATESIPGYRKFKESLLLPELNSDTGKKESRQRQSPKTPTELFADFVSATLVPSNTIDLEEIGKGRLRDLLYELCYREFNGNPERIIAELNRARECTSGTEADRDVVDQILKNVIPGLLHSLEAERRFTVPKTALFEPFGFQRSWVSGVLEGRSRILVGAPGCGKSEMLLLLAASNPSGRTVWFTPAPNRENAYKRALRRLDLPILDLSPKLLDKKPEAIEAELKSAALVIAAYPTLPALLRYRTDKFTVLQNWAKGHLGMADEGQDLDNWATKRTLAVKELKLGTMVIATGTPVHQKLENVASLINITYPDLYPDVLALKSTFKKDKCLRVALFHKHSKIISTDQIARTFIPFSEKSAADQVAMGLPCVPKLMEHEVSYALSADHTRRYINIILGEQRGAAAENQRTEHLRRLATARRLLAKPKALGAEPSYALLQAVKEIIIPAMKRGEKVIILGEHLGPLDLIFNDPEVQSFGVALVTGAQSMSDRAEVVRRLAEDPTLMCAVGQTRVLGTGHDCLGVEHVVFVDPPKVVSNLLQGMRRHCRLITEETIQYARPEAHVWYLKAGLDPEVVSCVPNEAHRKIFEAGSLFERWFNRQIENARNYRELTSHPSQIKIGEDTATKDVIKELLKQREELRQAREAFHALTAEQLEEYFFRYRIPEKTEWRESGLREFVLDALPLLRKSTRELRVALLPGPEALELPIYLDAGFLPSNILAFEAHPDELIREHCNEQVRRFGARFFSSRMEHVLPMLPDTVDFLSIDTNSYVTSELLQMVVSWKMPEQGVLLKNALCGREQGEASELLEAAGGSRKELDRILMRVAGSSLDRILGVTSMPKLIAEVRGIEAAAYCLAELLAPHVGLDVEDLADFMSSLGCNGSRVKFEKSIEYTSAKGSPFLSSFAVLERWNPPEKLEKSVAQLVDLLRSLRASHGDTNESLTFTVRETRNNFDILVTNTMTEKKLRAKISKSLFSSDTIGTSEGVAAQEALGLELASLA